LNQNDHWQHAMNTSDAGRSASFGHWKDDQNVMVTGDATHVRIDVSNNCGAAIEPATLARIFDPLERGQDRQSQDEKAASLGLGLYIASEIAKAHHGAIETRSDETETTFSVSLPRAKQ
jgi:signal transduction histidine kinase